MIVFGKEAQTGSAISVTQEQLQSGVYCLGVPGVGKSSLLLSLILQQIEAGEGVVVIDPHGDLLREVIARMPQGRIVDTYMLSLREPKNFYFGLNLFSCEHPDSSREVSATKNIILHAFAARWPEVKAQVYFENTLRPVIATLIERPGLTLQHTRKLFRDKVFRQQIVQGLTDREAIEFWEDFESWGNDERNRHTEPLLERIKKLLADETLRFILCQRQSKLNLRTLTRQRKIILLDLPLRDATYEYAAPFIGTFFTTLLQAAIFGMPPQKRVPCTIVIDEFQNFVTEDNERFYTEARKYQVKQILANQFTGQLEKTELKTMKQAVTNAHTIVCFRTNKDDALDMATLFSKMKRRPTAIYINVLRNMETYRGDPIVKEFYWNYVSRLQQAEQEQTQDKRVYAWSNEYKYKYDFGFGEVEYEPAQLQEVTKLLNDLFYYGEKEEKLDEKRLQAFLRAYNNIGVIVRRVKRKDIDPDWYRNEQRRIDTEEKEEERLIRERGVQRAAYLADKLEQLRQLHREWFALPEHISAGDPRVTWLCDQLEQIETKKFKEEVESVQSMTTYWQWFHSSEPWPRKEEQSLVSMKIDVEHVIIAQRQKSQRLPQLRKEKEALETIEIEYTADFPAFTQLLRTVCNALIQEPLAADESEILIPDIADTLKGLPNFEAYIKVASTLAHIRIQDVYTSYPRAVNTDDRIQTVIAQTKREFCKGKREIEAELEEAYQVKDIDAPKFDSEIKITTKVKPVEEPSPRADNLDKYENFTDF